MKQVLLKKRTWQILFAAFLPFFVLIEAYRGLVGPKISIGRFALEEVLVMLYAAVLFCAAAFFAWKEGKKKILLFSFGYFALFLLYTVLHSLHVIRFNTAVFSAAEPDFWVESYYLIRVFAFPAAVMFAAFVLRPKIRWILLSAEIAVLLTSLFIIVSDLFGFSYICYQNGRQVVDGGFFDWFSLPYGPSLSRYTAKGPFLIGNVMGAFLFALTPLCAWDFWREKKTFAFLVLFADGLASVMLGTKVPTLGFFAAVAAVSALWFWDRFLKKEIKKQAKAFLSLLCLFAVLLPLYFLSPGYRYQKVRLDDLSLDLLQDDALSRALERKENASSPKGEDGLSAEDQRLQAYVYGHYLDHFINWDHLEIYPFAEDPDFWRGVIERDPSLNHSYRSFKLEMASRIRERNDSPLDYVLGVGYTTNLPYAERDFADQFNLFGAVGLAVILLPPAAVFLWGIKRFLTAFFRKKECLFTGVFLLVIFCMGATGVAAGHILAGTGIVNTYLFYLSSGLLASRLNGGGEDEE